jgi:hypothetical protein
VKETSFAVKDGGGMKKSPVLTTFPEGAVTVICEEVAAVGTVAPILVAVEEETKASVRLNRTALFAGVIEKFVPLTVTAVPGVPIVGLNPVIVGAEDAAVTVKDAVLVAEPPGAITWIVPVVAPLGTLVVICVEVEAVTVAVTPLNLTVFWLGVALNPVP